VIGANIRDDPIFLHKTTSDVNIIDLPGFSDEDIEKMSQEEVDEHFNKPPLKGIDISDHLTKVSGLKCNVSCLKTGTCSQSTQNDQAKLAHFSAVAGQK
jgi:hypothetical protein